MLKILRLHKFDICHTLNSNSWCPAEVYMIQISGFGFCRSQHILNKPDRIRTMALFVFLDYDQDFQISFF